MVFYYGTFDGSDESGNIIGFETKDIEGLIPHLVLHTRDSSDYELLGERPYRITSIRDYGVYTEENNELVASYDIIKIEFKAKTKDSFNSMISKIEDYLLDIGYAKSSLKSTFTKGEIQKTEYFKKTYQNPDIEESVIKDEPTVEPETEPSEEPVTEDVVKKSAKSKTKSKSEPKVEDGSSK